MRVRRLIPVALAAGAALYLRGVYRYRDPVRLPKVGVGEVLSAADGVVGFVRRVEDGRADGLDVPALLGTPGAADGWLIGVPVGPLDVHYVFQPVSGAVSYATHVGARVNVPLLDAAGTLGVLAGRAVDALSSRGALENERQAAVVGTPDGDVTVTLVAGRAGLSGTSFTREGTRCAPGTRLRSCSRAGWCCCTCRWRSRRP